MRAWQKITGIAVGAIVGTLLVRKASGLAVKYLEKEIASQKKRTAESFARVAPTIFFTQGFDLEEDKVLHTEQMLIEAPKNMRARCLLLGFYSRAGRGTSERKKFQEHALWVIENYPHTSMARECNLHPWNDTDEVYQKGNKSGLTTAKLVKPTVPF